MGTEIIVRYGCDGCGRLFRNKEDLNVVKVRVMRSSEGRTGIEFEEQNRMYCHKCLLNRTAL